MFDQCTADQFINCAAFDEMRNIWSIMQHTCNQDCQSGFLKTQVLLF